MADNSDSDQPISSPSVVKKRKATTLAWLRNKMSIDEVIEKGWNMTKKSGLQETTDLNFQIIDQRYRDICQDSWDSLALKDKKNYWKMIIENNDPNSNTLKRQRRQSGSDEENLDPNPITESAKKKKKTLKIRDPSMPKRPPNTYLLFSKDIRESVVKEQPDLKPKEVVKVISEKWKQLNDDEKSVYESKRNDLIEIYQQEMKKYSEKN